MGLKHMSRTRCTECGRTLYWDDDQDGDRVLYAHLESRHNIERPTWTKGDRLTPPKRR